MGNIFPKYALSIVERNSISTTFINNVKAKSMKATDGIQTKELQGIETGGYLVIDRDVYIVLEAKTTMIGRHSENDCIINDPFTSRHHAKIEYENGDYVLYDLDSSTGTFINKERITRHVLKYGDVIILGKYPIIFMYDENDIVQKHEMDTGVF